MSDAHQYLFGQAALRLADNFEYSLNSIRLWQNEGLAYRPRALTHCGSDCDYSHTVSIFTKAAGETFNCVNWLYGAPSMTM
jgi:hypothetical protein